MATPEAKVKNWLKNRLKIRYPNIWIYMAPGGPFGRAGTPDLLCCINGLFVAIEVKSDGHQMLTQKQAHECRRISKAGGITCVIKGKDVTRLDRLCNVIEGLSIQKSV